jgi:hypothetical protein
MMDNSSETLHLFETEKQSMQRVKKGQPGPTKARVHTTRAKQMVLVFFVKKCVI